MPSNSERFSDLPLSFVLAVIGADEESFDIAEGDADIQVEPDEIQ